MENLKMFGLLYLSINSNAPIIAIAFKILKGNDFVDDKMPLSAGEAHATNQAVYNHRGWRLPRAKRFQMEWASDRCL